VANLLFPAPAASYDISSFPGELLWVPRRAPAGGGDPGGKDGEAWRGSSDTVPCLLLEQESARFLILFFHGNAEDLGRCRWFCQFLREQFQCHILAVEYPGYGVAGGEATRGGIAADAEAVLRFVTEVLHLPLEQVKIFGRSIGTGPAMHLASRYKVAGLVLVTPFLSVRGLFRDRVGPLSMLVDEWFQNDEAMLDVQSPTLIVHGRKDRIIPWHHADELYRICSVRKLLVSPKSMEHNANLTSNVSYLTMPMFRFFALPDYSFQELRVPAWAFDKRRSELYAKPAAEVQAGAASPLLPRTLSIPQGDAEEEQPEQDGPKLPEREPTEALQGRARSAAGDSPVVDYEAATVLSNPLVRHTYFATKKIYDFHGGGLAECWEDAEEEAAARAGAESSAEGESEDLPEELALAALGKAFGMLPGKPRRLKEGSAGVGDCYHEGCVEDPGRGRQAGERPQPLLAALAADDRKFAPL